jgi:hypothetical protein
VPLLSTDPIDLRLDDDGDLYVGPNGPELTTGGQAVTQGIRIAVSMFAGEWFLDMDAGVPWLAGNGVPDEKAILGPKYDELKVRTALRKEILAVPGVAGIEELSITFERRVLTVSWKVTTAFDDTIEDALNIEDT